LRRWAAQVSVSGFFKLAPRRAHLVTTSRFALALAALALAAPSATAQQPGSTSAQAVAAVQAGTYELDSDHSQVLWTVNHSGFAPLRGLVGAMTGTLELDPRRLGEARVAIDIPLSGMTVSSPGFGKHLQAADLFNVAQFPTARFVSRSVRVNGQQATIAGDLTIRGQTRPVTLDARLHGAGVNPRSKAETVGFTATGEVKRSDFGLGLAAPVVSDAVRIEVNAVFRRKAG
jgi:polyisoprenoid-binding protein YceI